MLASSNEPLNTTAPSTEPTPTTEATPTLEVTTMPTLPSDECGGAGWRRVAYINMTDPDQTCPPTLGLTPYSIRSCGRTDTQAQFLSDICTSIFFPVGQMEYSHVCGRAKAYRWGHHYGFSGYNERGQTTIDDAYLDSGLSLTYGSPRTHIWSFASGLFNGNSGDIVPQTRCPCDEGNTYGSPPFVGNDYFCDTIATVDNYDVNAFRFYPDNALWDGQDCLANSPCCEFNNPPWFRKQLACPTTDDIEMRVCFAKAPAYSNIGLELVELFVY